MGVQTESVLILVCFVHEVTLKRVSGTTSTLPLRQSYRPCFPESAEIYFSQRRCTWPERVRILPMHLYCVPMGACVT
jgi:hypothetical protein